MTGRASPKWLAGCWPTAAHSARSACRPASTQRLGPREEWRSGWPRFTQASRPPRRDRGRAPPLGRYQDPWAVLGGCLGLTAFGCGRGVLCIGRGLFGFLRCLCGLRVLGLVRGYHFPVNQLHQGHIRPITATRLPYEDLRLTTG